ncbi:MAG TPA: hypothetical protein VF816_15625 [Rhodocyclaceae bacterium]
MVSDLRNRDQVERFLRNASAEELVAQRDRIASLRSQSQSAVADAERLMARIAYELRFRVPQPI